MPEREGYPAKTYRASGGAHKAGSSTPIPVLKSRPKKKKPRKGHVAGLSISDKIDFSTSTSPKDKAPAIRDAHNKSRKESDRHKTSAKEELHRGLAKGLATASAGLSGRGTAGRILKAGLAGAAGGAEIDAAYQRSKDRAKKKKAKAAKTTVSQSAMKQKSNFHKKDDTDTEKV